METRDYVRREPERFYCWQLRITDEIEQELPSPFRSWVLKVDHPRFKNHFIYHKWMDERKTVSDTDWFVLDEDGELEVYGDAEFHDYFVKDEL